MKIHFLLAPAFAACSTFATAADYTEDNNKLSVSGSASESYVNRVTDEAVRQSVDLSIAGASYTGHNVNITNNCLNTGGTAPGAIIASKNNHTITLTADEGTWNTLITNGDVASGISIFNGSGNSSISNTKIYKNGTSGYGIYTMSLANPLLLDNVEIHISDNSGNEDPGVALWATMATITNKAGDGTVNRGVTITSDNSGYATAAIVANYLGIVDLYNSSIDVRKVRDNEGIICAHAGSTVSLTDSAIASGAGNSLVMANTNSNNIVNLSNVNLDNAKGMRINNRGTGSRLTFNLSDGTNFDGYATVEDSAGQNNINIATGASWNVTQNSDLGSGTLTLGGASAISFITDNGDFTNINAASVMLASGSILQLDQNADYFEIGDIVTLFTGAIDEYFANYGALLMTRDGISLLYQDNDNGTFTILGLDVIPEPATATLGLIGLSLLAFRRRKTA